MDDAFARAALLAAGGDVTGAAALVASSLAAAPEGNAGWLLPIEPLLQAARGGETWARALLTLRMRAV